MLRGIHKASSGWLGKGIMTLVMGLLVVSFAIWGIADIFRGFGQSTFADIGSTGIGIEQFRYYYNDKISQLSRRLGRPVTPDQARALGLDRQIVSQLVAETALDENARKLGLAVSNDEIARQIRSQASFQSPNGQFDRQRFEQTIRDAGFTEARFVQEQRALTLRRQIALSLTGEIKPPLAIQTAFNQFRNEKRSVELAVLGPAQAGDVASPTPDVLQKYFDERKVLFRAPEARKVVLLPLTPADQARWETVTDEDAKSYYQQHKVDYGTPEKRQVRQIVFPTADDARAASEKIASGASFDDIAQERNLKPSDTDLGTVTKAGMLDPAVADAAFALQENAVSAPVQGRFGTVLLQVTKIEPGNEQSFEQVAPKIKSSIALDRGRRAILDLRDKIEDDRAGGATLAETAKKLNLTARTIDAIDRSGRDPAGNPVPGLPPAPNLIASIFASDVGVDNEPLQLPGGGWLWYDVGGIAPSRERNLDEVKDQVEKRWRDDEIATRLKAKSDEMVDKLKAGGKLSELADSNGVKVSNVGELQRGEAKPPVSANALDVVFRTAKGAAGSAEGDDATSRIVFVVTDIADPKLDPAAPETAEQMNTLQTGYDEDFLSQYVSKIEGEIGVTINQTALQQIVGGGSGG